jgi:hypothetical protein
MKIAEMRKHEHAITLVFKPPSDRIIVTLSEDYFEKNRLNEMINDVGVEPLHVVRLDLSLVRLSGQDTGAGAGRWGFLAPQSTTTLCSSFFTIKVLNRVCSLFPNLMALTLPTRGNTQKIIIAAGEQLELVKN